MPSQTMPAPPTQPGPTLSPFTQVRTTAHSGRGVYAATSIPRGTLLLTSPDLAAHVIYAEYRKEVCAWCFAYDWGRSWKIRLDGLGVWFCSIECKDQWRGDFDGCGGGEAGTGWVEGAGSGAVDGDSSVECFEAVEKLCRNGARFREDGDDEFSIKPSLGEVLQVWTDPAIEEEIDELKTARNISTHELAIHAGTSKTQKRSRQTLRHTLRQAYDRNVTSYQLSGLLCALHRPDLWRALLELKAAEQPFQFRAEVRRNVQGVKGLVAVLPVEVLKACGECGHGYEGTESAEVAGEERNAECASDGIGNDNDSTVAGMYGRSNIRARLWELTARSAHNSFNIWSLDYHNGKVTEREDGTFESPRESGPSGSECLGYGTWPSASYWNHSCAPNLFKRRLKRTWCFWTNRDVTEDEELCISYLGGDEVTLTVAERRERLKNVWGFDCACTRCSAESH